MTAWFEVDRKGLAKLLEKRGKAFAIFELVQNAWDTGATVVDVRLEKETGKPYAKLFVEDNDPDGFSDLTHAYTLFAESGKKGDARKRGRFNMGEKLVLALCVEASVHSVRGAVYFDAKGRHTTTRENTREGSVFRALIKMTTEEFHEVEEQVRRLLPPTGVTTRFNGRSLDTREPIASFEASLSTVLVDEEGNLKRGERVAKVNVHKPLPGEAATIYEMGIPIVETGDAYHIDVQQKVPLNADRDNVPPSYLRLVRALTLNSIHARLDKVEAAEGWVTDALHHPKASGEAVTTAMAQRFGEKRAVYDPTDQEANNRLVAEGYTIIHGGTFGKAAWQNIKASNAALPAGEIRPTPKPPYSEVPDAPNVDVVPFRDWTEGMCQVSMLAKRLAKELMGVVDLNVTIVRTTNSFSACYGCGTIDFNLMRLGRKWFSEWQTRLDEVLDLLIHEFGHHYESNHLSERYHEALTKLGGKLARLALERPAIIVGEVRGAKK